MEDNSKRKPPLISKAVLESLAAKRKTRKLEPVVQVVQDLIPESFNYYGNNQVLIDDVLYRLCNWSYEWIQERKKPNNNVVSSLLNEIQRENGMILPKLPLLKVPDTFESLELYCAIFAALLIHETWATLCQEIETTKFESFSILIGPKPKYLDGFALLNCEALSSRQLTEMDFVVLTAPQNNPHSFFGVVKDVISTRNFLGKIDRRLLEKFQPNIAYRKYQFALWIKMSNVPKGLDDIFSMTKMIRLNTLVKPLRLNAELVRSPLCNIILRPKENPDALRMDTLQIEENHLSLNPSQHLAVESIARTMVYAREPKIALLQGPPGTGKSHVIIKIISRIMSIHLERSNCLPCLLVCAPSNNAIDEIATRLLRFREFKVLRIGVPESIHPNVLKISLERLSMDLHRKRVDSKISLESNRLASLKENLDKLTKEKASLAASTDASNESKLMEEQLGKKIAEAHSSYRECYKAHSKCFPVDLEILNQQVITQAQVVCTTLNFCRSSQMEKLFSGKSFLCCILDEASQCTEPESLTPLFYGIEKLVLIGDPNQLPATVISQVATKNGLDQSLFNRLYTIRKSENEGGVMMLNTQYRMAHSICEWPSKYFYDGKLETAEGLVREGPCFEYRVLNVIDSLEEFCGTSFRNEREASLVSKILKLIIDVSSSGKSIGVITFYHSQKELIAKKLKENGVQASRVEVNTVDSFQGREKDIVVVSCVRAFKRKNPTGSIDFISTPYRINVALTRAKDALIVCGNFATLQTNQKWYDLIRDAIHRDVAKNVNSGFTSEMLRPILCHSMPNK